MGNFLRNYIKGRPAGTGNFHRNQNWRPTVTGYAALDSTITANSTTKSPILLLYGSNAAATWTPEVGATTLSVAGAGTAPTYGNAGDYGLSVHYAGSGKYHQGDADAYGIGTEDFCIEAVFRYANTANATPVYKYGGSPTTGWIVDVPSSGNMRLYIRNNATTFSLATSGGSLVDDTWYHLMVFVDRDENSTNGARMYIDGALVASGNASAMSALSLDISTTRVIVSSASTDTGGTRTGEVAVWKQATWFAGGGTNATEWLAIAAARYAALQ